MNLSGRLRVTISPRRITPGIPFMNLVFKWVGSPVGALKLVGHDAGLAAISWERGNPRRVRWALSPKILTIGCLARPSGS